jgi:hypothetical protein
MDFASALRPDAYRVVLTNVIPGFVGTAPWVAGFFWPALMDVGFWSNSGIAFPVTITLAAIALAAGLVFEDIGSRVETYWADAWLKRRCPRFSRGWREYLAQRRDESLIAQGYLRAILLRFKFELSMIPALVSSCIGVIIAELDGNGLGIGQTFILALVMFGLAAMLLDEVRKGAVVLTRTRRIILRGAKGG